ncbi:MAG: hypothetical protein GTO41_23040 [Burkholderiales bacterium]|nr:hypothetical protein [Burkholderiales bacterium]
MKTLRAVLLIVTALLALPARAVDGNELYKWGTQWKQSDAQRAQDAGSYAGYVQGFIDLHRDLSDPEIGMLKMRLFCLPARTQLDQVLDVVFRYLEGHPEKRRFTGSSLVSAALWGAFPCD